MQKYLRQIVKLHPLHPLQEILRADLVLGHYSDGMMGVMLFQITGVSIVCSIVQAQIKGSTKALCHWPLCGKFTCVGEFPKQWASNAENVSIM